MCAADKIDSGSAKRESPFRVRDTLAYCRACGDDADDAPFDLGRLRVVVK